MVTCPILAPRAFRVRPEYTKPAISAGFLEADEGARTLDLLHGKQMLYQLSYIRARPEL